MVEFEQSNYGGDGGFGGRIEHSLLLERERTEISPASLKADNQSELSQNLIATAVENRNNGEIIIEEQCSDARPPEANPEDIFRNPSVAANGPTEPFQRIYNDHRAKAVIIKPHFAMRSFRPGQKPGGCGGGAAKGAQMQNGAPATEGDINAYVRDFVPHEDVVINSLYRGLKLALLTENKYSLATAIAHDTGDLFVLGWFRKKPSGSIESLTAVPLNVLFDNNYNPEKIYENGIPNLMREDIPDVFQERLQAYDDLKNSLHEQYPDFEEAQKVQNPKLLVISKNIKGPAVRYANTLSKPGSFFEIRVGRQRIDDDIENFDKPSFEQAMNQAHFPIARSVAHHEDPNQDFSDLNRILFETGSMDMSIDLAKELQQRPWMKDWLSLPNHRIMAARTRAGNTEAIDYIT